jgi:hypothetical protein
LTCHFTFLITQTNLSKYVGLGNLFFAEQCRELYNFSEDNGGSPRSCCLCLPNKICNNLFSRMVNVSASVNICACDVH